MHSWIRSRISGIPTARRFSTLPTLVPLIDDTKWNPPCPSMSVRFSTQLGLRIGEAGWNILGNGVRERTRNNSPCSPLLAWNTWLRSYEQDRVACYLHSSSIAGLPVSSHETIENSVHFYTCFSRNLNIFTVQKPAVWDLGNLKVTARNISMCTWRLNWSPKRIHDWQIIT